MYEEIGLFKSWCQEYTRYPCFNDLTLARGMGMTKIVRVSNVVETALSATMASLILCYAIQEIFQSIGMINLQGAH